MANGSDSATYAVAEYRPEASLRPQISPEIRRLRAVAVFVIVI